VCQINDHSREKTGFSRPEKKTGSIELSGSVDQAGKHSRQSPGNHDARRPFSCAPALHEDGAWDLEEDVAYEEHRHAQAVNSIAKAEIEIHSKGGEGHVCTVQISDQIEEKYERQKPPRDTPPGA
jgi:hypothetical protein